MTSNHDFNFGDRVVHAARPEWGEGTVSAAQGVKQDGIVVQRLTIRFERAGLKTVSTAHADIRPADAVDRPAGELADEPADWLDEVSARDLPQKMATLPEPATDPFSSLEARLKATADLYRFSDAGGSLLDWAAMQTGLRDPMSRFNRHQLEEFFRRFAQNRDEHLGELLREAMKKDPAVVARVAGDALPAAQAAMKRLHAGR